MTVPKSDLYKATNLSKATIGSIYKGLATSVTLNTLEGICKGLGVTMSEFLDSKYFKRAEETPKEPVA
ncbi:MAG: helix-turn-helix transcriptional regulator [Bacteroidales bacterium]|nr:helix-turn-helix transcriptional regulator [Bacteroidales bacterium]